MHYFDSIFKSVGEAYDFESELKIDSHTSLKLPRDVLVNRTGVRVGRWVEYGDPALQHLLISLV